MECGIYINNTDITIIENENDILAVNTSSSVAEAKIKYNLIIYSLIQIINGMNIEDAQIKLEEVRRKCL